MGHHDQAAMTVADTAGGDRVLPGAEMQQDPAGVAALSIAGISHSYGPRRALVDVSFTVAPASFTALLGLNGAGKSTLFSLVTRLFGDALVPVASATDGGCTDGASLALPPSHIRFRPGLGHLALAHHPLVYDDIRAFLEERT